MKMSICVGACIMALSGAAQSAVTGNATRGFDLPAIPSGNAVLDWTVKAGDLVMRRGRGADDPAGDDRGRRHGGHGADDPAGHTMLDGLAPSVELARRGADDGPGDDHGRRHGGHGADDNGTGTDASGSGRKKPRVPGGSGCDDAGDIAEHAGCRG